MNLELEHLNERIDNQSDITTALLLQIGKLSERVATLETRTSHENTTANNAADVLSNMIDHTAAHIKFLKEKGDAQHDAIWKLINRLDTLETRLDGRDTTCDGDTVEISAALFEALRSQASGADDHGVATITIPLAEYNELKRAQRVTTALAALEAFAMKRPGRVSLMVDILASGDDGHAIDVDIVDGRDTIAHHNEVFDSVASAIIAAVDDLAEYDIDEDSALVLRRAIVSRDGDE